MSKSKNRSTSKPESAKNRLANETSPYLLQHAANPVDWHAWGEEALTLARETGKPILLSIGYSACHWCHVMAHESFEDEETGRQMNELYVNIKVDREERPDIDKIYQTAHQLLTQRGGGWPLTMFINPDDQRPFFGGTYFPDEPRHGMPAFRDLIARVADYYQNHKDDIREQGEQLIGVFDRLAAPAADQDGPLDTDILANARVRLAQDFDREFGGFGSAPKFPHPSSLERLLRDWRASANDAEPDVDALFMVSLTLTRMAEGGIYDQLGGGFCRYTVDRSWQIPHFEKMLYDNGPLLALYAQLFQASGDALFGQIAAETADWMLRDMRAPEGSFYSSLDADSEGEEGLFYVWTPGSVNKHLDADEFPLFAARYGLDSDANFEGRWHLSVRQSVEQPAGTATRSADDTERLIESARQKLLAIRNDRVWPGRDDKQLTSWNALAIRGLAIAGRALQREDLVNAADTALEFIKDKLVVDGRLFASHKDGRTRFAAYLDDHAFLLDALLELLQARWNTGQLELATQIADLMLEYFEDREHGGFFFTASDHESLMHRPKPYADDSMPAGNGIAAFALQRLGFLLGRTDYLAAAEKTLKSAGRMMTEYPHGHVSLLNALEEYLHHPEFIIIRGCDDNEEASRWRDSAAQIYAPRRLLFAIPGDEADLPGALAARSAKPGETVAYRCTGNTCSLPMTSWEALAADLSRS